MKGGCDIALTIEWEAINEDYSLKGDIKIENLLESMKFYDIETEITILAPLEEEEQFCLFDLMKTRGNEEVKSLLSIFLKNLRESFINFEKQNDVDDSTKEIQKIKNRLDEDNSPPITPREENLKKQIKQRKKRKQFQENLQDFSSSSSSTSILSIFGYASILTAFGASIYFIKKKYYD